MPVIYGPRPSPSPDTRTCQRGPMPDARCVCPTFLRIQECDSEGLCPPSPSSLATNLLRMQECDGEGFFPPSPSFLPTFAVHLCHYLSPYAFHGHSNMTVRDYSHPRRLFCPLCLLAAIRTRRRGITHTFAVLSAAPRFVTAIRT